MTRDYTKIKAWQLAKGLGYLDTNRYEELWAKAQEDLKTLQGLISYIEKSGV
jgi:hypothetical protein